MQANRNEQPGRNLGFTFIELLVVLALMTILVAFALPSYQSAVQRAKRAEAWTVMMKNMQQQERHYSVHGRYAEFSADEPKGFLWYSGSTPQNSAYEISARECEGHTLKQCVMLVAQPGAAGVQHGYSDQDCGTLTLNSAGIRTASGEAAPCW